MVCTVPEKHTAFAWCLKHQKVILMCASTHMGRLGAICSGQFKKPGRDHLSAFTVYRRNGTAKLQV
jgi:hypothetical protein